MSEVYIISACRTPIGSFCGQFSGLGPVELAIPALKGAVERANVPPANIDEIYVGNVLSAGKGQNIARQAAIGAGIPEHVPASSLNLLCGSGLKTIYNAFNSIKAGSSDIVLCGATESMTSAEHVVNIRGIPKIGHANLKDTLYQDGLRCAFNDCLMGITAEEVVSRFNITREEQDRFAYDSQQKTAEALKSGYFKPEIVGVEDPVTGGLILKDEFPRPDTTLEGLSKLEPKFKSNGTVTAGNASGINDGAAALLVASSKAVADYNLKPIARVVGLKETAGEALVMGIIPLDTVRQLLKKISWSVDDVDLFELNEAYASQSIVINRELGVDESKVNVCGGAIALGHPLGCSGSRVLVTLIYSLLRLKKKRGVAALCIGGGMGIAIAVEIV